MTINKLAYFGGNPLFATPKSTSNLVRPDKSVFKKYLKNYVYQIDDQKSIIQEFKNRFSELHGVKHCIPVINGLWALVVTINELKIEGKTEIIMPSLTYRRMADIAAWVGLTPRFCDVNLDDFSVTRDNIANCINNETALVLAPHPIVNICDVRGITKLCNEHNLPLLIDAVESYYADINGQRVGSFGRAECFSLHASKFLNGFEGGYITTNDDELAFRLNSAIKGGIIAADRIVQFGINLSMPEYHAAMALACLDDVDNQIQHNKEIYYEYKKGIKSIDGLHLIEYSELEKRSFKNILVELNENWVIPRDVLIELMHAENLIVRPYYTPPLHEMKRSYKTYYSILPNTDYWKTRLLLLPSGYFVAKEDVQMIVDFLAFCKYNASKILQNYVKHER